WIGTDGGGLEHVHQRRIDLFSSSDGLSGDEIPILFEDRERNIWVATGNGLDQFHEFVVPAFTSHQGLTGAVYSVLAARDGSVWLTTSRGLNRWNDGRFMIYETGTASAQIANVPYSLFQDDGGRIWAVTSREFGYIENGRLIPISGI